MKRLVRFSTKIYRSLKRRFNKFIVTRQLASVGSNCAVDESVTVYNGENIVIGNNIVLNKGVILQSCEEATIKIGNDVTLSYGVKVITGNLSLNETIISKERVHNSNNIIIGDYVWIGTNSIILPGVEIAGNIIIAAGSIVTKSLTESNYIYAGCPASKIKKICE